MKHIEKNELIEKEFILNKRKEIIQLVHTQTFP